MARNYTERYTDIVRRADDLIAHYRGQEWSKEIALTRNQVAVVMEKLGSLRYRGITFYLQEA